MAYRQWLESTDNTDLSTILETAMSLLATIVPKAPRSRTSAAPRTRRRSPATRLY
jgi:hypothetical protein